MITTLMGLGLIVASGGVIYPFIPAKGIGPNRSWSSQWVDEIWDLAAFTHAAQSLRVT